MWLDYDDIPAEIEHFLRNIDPRIRTQFLRKIRESNVRTWDEFRTKLIKFAIAILGELSFRPNGEFEIVTDYSKRRGLHVIIWEK
jgi:hypothetical protein